MVFLSIGSNLGDSLNTLRQAAIDIEKSLGAIASASSIYESEPWGFDAGQNFLNAVLAVDTSLSPEKVLRKINEIENAHGRIRPQTGGYSSRTLDIDIVFYDDLILDSAALNIPHPRLHERLFVLLPLAEIAPDLIHPVSKLSVGELLDACKDRGMIRQSEAQLHVPTL